MTDTPTNQTPSPNIDHSSQARPGITPFPDRLYVVTAISNPCRYRSRYNLYKAFAKHVADSGAILYTVELAFGNRPFEITQAGNPQHVQVRCTDELWHKENLWNVGVAHLPPGAKYIATLDADITFARPDWAQETIQQLQHYPVVQVFSSVSYLGPNGEILTPARPGFVAAWEGGAALKVGSKVVSKSVFYASQPVGAQSVYNGEFGAPGAGWAYRRDALDALGGLVDYCILGSADYFMSLGLVGFMQYRIPSGYTKALKDRLMQWQVNAERFIQRNVGVVPGSILHSWHGPMKQRNYGTREQILIRDQFNPDTDIKPNSYGVMSLVNDGTARRNQLRDDLRSYFRARNEDSIDL